MVPVTLRRYGWVLEETDPPRTDALSDTQAYVYSPPVTYNALTCCAIRKKGVAKTGSAAGIPSDGRQVVRGNAGERLFRNRTTSRADFCYNTAQDPAGRRQHK